MKMKKTGMMMIGKINNINNKFYFILFYFIFYYFLFYFLLSIFLFYIKKGDELWKKNRMKMKKTGMMMIGKINNNKFYFILFYFFIFIYFFLSFFIFF